jgi:lipopolysaccharide/colanic/teichoic acid biosynthesis glycosyltransferase
MLKRTLDILIAGLLLVVLLPFLLCLAIAIKWESRGPALYRQARMGRGFHPFQIFKLRTMRDCGMGPTYTLGDDPRITPLGRWLRRKKLDELPQLWNVLRGEMSLVGPRPVIPELADEFRPAYLRLLLVRPGLTDPATILYCREAEMLARHSDPLRYFKTVATPDKLRIAQAYLDHATVWSDLGVLVCTISAVFDRSDSGFDKKAENAPVPVAARMESENRCIDWVLLPNPMENRVNEGESTLSD